MDLGSGSSWQLLTASNSSATSLVPEDSPGQSQPLTDQCMNAADIDRIVSLVAARIDPSHNLETSNSPPDFYILQSDPQASRSVNTLPTQLPELPSAASPSIPSSPPRDNVNIDTILSLLAARVDPFHAQVDDVGDLQDRPPSYLVPPGYNG